MIRVVVSLALALQLGLVSAQARAQAQSTDAEARQHYLAGQKLFDQASYAAALDEFERSYQLSRYPAILYKMALCRDQLGPPAQAISAYQRYLEADPTTSRKAGIEARIAKLKALAPEPAPTRAKVEAALTQPIPARAQAAPPVPPRAAPLATAPAAALARPATAPAHTPVYKKWWLWTIVGAAVAGAAVGVGIALAPPRSPNDFQPSLGRINLVVEPR